MQPACISLHSVRDELRFCCDHVGVKPRPQAEHWPLSFAVSRPAPDIEGITALLQLFQKATSIYILPDGTEFFELRPKDEGRDLFKAVA